MNIYSNKKSLSNYPSNFNFFLGIAGFETQSQQNQYTLEQFNGYYGASKISLLENTFLNLDFDFEKNYSLFRHTADCCVDGYNKNYYVNEKDNMDAIYSSVTNVYKTILDYNLKNSNQDKPKFEKIHKNFLKVLININLINLEIQRYYKTFEILSIKKYIHQYTNDKNLQKKLYKQALKQSFIVFAKQNLNSLSKMKIMSIFEEVKSMSNINLIQNQNEKTV